MCGSEWIQLPWTAWIVGLKLTGGGVVVVVWRRVHTVSDQRSRMHPGREEGEAVPIDQIWLESVLGGILEREVVAVVRVRRGLVATLDERTDLLREDGRAGSIAARGDEVQGRDVVHEGHRADGQGLAAGGVEDVQKQESLGVQGQRPLQRGGKIQSPEAGIGASAGDEVGDVLQDDPVLVYVDREEVFGSPSEMKHVEQIFLDERGSPGPVDLGLASLGGSPAVLVESAGLIAPKEDVLGVREASLQEEVGDVVGDALLGDLVVVQGLGAWAVQQRVQVSVQQEEPKPVEGDSQSDLHPLIEEMLVGELGRQGFLAVVEVNRDRGLVEQQRDDRLGVLLELVLQPVAGLSDLDGALRPPQQSVDPDDVALLSWMSQLGADALAGLTQLQRTLALGLLVLPGRHGGGRGRGGPLGRRGRQVHDAPESVGAGGAGARGCVSLTLNLGELQAGGVELREQESVKVHAQSEGAAGGLLLQPKGKQASWIYDHGRVGDLNRELDLALLVLEAELEVELGGRRGRRVSRDPRGDHREQTPVSICETRHWSLQTNPGGVAERVDLEVAGVRPLQQLEGQGRPQRAGDSRVPKRLVLTCGLVEEEARRRTQAQTVNGRDSHGQEWGILAIGDQREVRLARGVEYRVIEAVLVFGAGRGSVASLREILAKLSEDADCGSGSHGDNRDKMHILSKVAEPTDRVMLLGRLVEEAQKDHPAGVQSNGPVHALVSARWLVGDIGARAGESVSGIQENQSVLEEVDHKLDLHVPKQHVGAQQAGERELPAPDASRKPSSLSCACQSLQSAAGVKGAGTVAVHQSLVDGERPGVQHEGREDPLPPIHNVVGIKLIGGILKSSDTYTNRVSRLDNGPVGVVGDCSGRPVALLAVLAHHVGVKVLKGARPRLGVPGEREVQPDQSPVRRLLGVGCVQPHAPAPRPHLVQSACQPLECRPEAAGLHAPVVEEDCRTGLLPQAPETAGGTIRLKIQRRGEHEALLSGSQIGKQGKQGRPRDGCLQKQVRHRDVAPAVRELDAPAQDPQLHQTLRLRAVLVDRGAVRLAIEDYSVLCGLIKGECELEDVAGSEVDTPGRELDAAADSASLEHLQQARTAVHALLLGRQDRHLETSLGLLLSFHDTDKMSHRTADLLDPGGAPRARQQTDRPGPQIEAPPEVHGLTVPVSADTAVQEILDGRVVFEEVERKDVGEAVVELVGVDEVGELEGGAEGPVVGVGGSLREGPEEPDDVVWLGVGTESAEGVPHTGLLDGALAVIPEGAFNEAVIHEGVSVGLEGCVLLDPLEDAPGPGLEQRDLVNGDREVEESRDPVYGNCNPGRNGHHGVSHVEVPDLPLLDQVHHSQVGLVEQHDEERHLSGPVANAVEVGRASVAELGQILDCQVGRELVVLRDLGGALDLEGGGEAVRGHLRVLVDRADLPVVSGLRGGPSRVEAIDEGCAGRDDRPVGDDKLVDVEASQRHLGQTLVAQDHEQVRDLDLLSDAQVLPLEDLDVHSDAELDAAPAGQRAPDGDALLGDGGVVGCGGSLGHRELPAPVVELGVHRDVSDGGRQALAVGLEGVEVQNRSSLETDGAEQARGALCREVDQVHLLLVGDDDAELDVGVLAELLLVGELVVAGEAREGVAERDITLKDVDQEEIVGLAADGKDGQGAREDPQGAGEVCGDQGAAVPELHDLRVAAELSRTGPLANVVSLVTLVEELALIEDVEDGGLRGGGLGAWREGVGRVVLDRDGVGEGGQDLVDGEILGVWDGDNDVVGFRIHNKDMVRSEEKRDAEILRVLADDVHRGARDGLRGDQVRDRDGGLEERELIESRLAGNESPSIHEILFGLWEIGDLDSDVRDPRQGLGHGSGILLTRVHADGDVLGAAVGEGQESAETPGRGRHEGSAVGRGRCQSGGLRSSEREPAGLRDLGAGRSREGSCDHSPAQHLLQGDVVLEDADPELREDQVLGSLDLQVVRDVGPEAQDLPNLGAELGARQNTIGLSPEELPGEVPARGGTESLHEEWVRTASLGRDDLPHSSKALGKLGGHERLAPGGDDVKPALSEDDPQIIDEPHVADLEKLPQLSPDLGLGLLEVDPNHVRVDNDVEQLLAWGGLVVEDELREDSLGGSELGHAPHDELESGDEGGLRERKNELRGGAALEEAEGAAPGAVEQRTLTDDGARGEHAYDSLVRPQDPVPVCKLISPVINKEGDLISGTIGPRVCRVSSRAELSPALVKQHSIPREQETLQHGFILGILELVDPKRSILSCCGAGFGVNLELLRLNSAKLEAYKLRGGQCTPT
ncbi:hypothetical protein OIY81_3423 [Cryptosporidium canis]|nr:hypothetical protein OIY81_3423 [Cryptosporidium canis]